MKNYSIFAGFFVILSSFDFTSDLYSKRFKTIDGQTIELSNYRNRKLVFVILPVAEKDSARLDDLFEFRQKYDSKIEIIGIVTAERTSTKDDDNRVIDLFRKKKLDILLTEAVLVGKENSSRQSDLLRWLTDKEMNERFEEKEIQKGQMFFVDEAGKLYAVLSSQAPLNAEMIRIIVNKPLRK